MVQRIVNLAAFLDFLRECAAAVRPRSQYTLGLFISLCTHLKLKIYRTMITPVFLYGCETWSLTMMEERRLRVFENRVLRRLFGPRGDEVTGKWRKIYNEELNDLYSSSNTVLVINSRRMRWVGHVARMGERRGAYRVWWGILKERDHFGDPCVDGRIILR